MAIKMARPTTTSAAATTITKKATTCPSRFPCSRANETNARLHAFSMSSTDMKIRIALRLISTPTAPMTNRMTARNTYAAGLMRPPRWRSESALADALCFLVRWQAGSRDFSLPGGPCFDLPLRVDPLLRGQAGGDAALRVAAELHVALDDRRRYRTVRGGAVGEHRRHVHGVVQRVHAGRRLGGDLAAFDLAAGDVPLRRLRRGALAVGQDHRAEGGGDQQGAGDFKRVDVGGEDQLGQAGEVRAALRAGRSGRRADRRV